jgi:hypothetical protein
VKIFIKDGYPVVYAYDMPGDMEDMSVNLECEGE